MTELTKESLNAFLDKLSDDADKKLSDAEESDYGSEEIEYETDGIVSTIIAIRKEFDIPTNP